MTIFFGFHCWLIAKNMTTIEFCEKSSGKTDYKSIYSDGLYNNICAALGDSPLLWCLPLSLPSGGGLSFAGGTGLDGGKYVDRFETIPIVADGGNDVKNRTTPRSAGAGGEKTPLLAGGGP